MFCTSQNIVRTLTWARRAYFFFMVRNRKADRLPFQCLHVCMWTGLEVDVQASVHSGPAGDGLVCVHRFKHTEKAECLSDVRPLCGH